VLFADTFARYPHPAAN